MASREPVAGRELSPGAAAVRFLRLHPNLIRVVVVAIFFIAWEYFGRSVSPLFLSTPTKVFVATWEVILSGDLAVALKESLLLFTVGMTVSIVGGIALGVMLGQWWFIEYTLDPFVNALYVTPRIALLPLIILWAGLETAGKLTILISIAIFPVIINTYAGIKDVRGSLLEIGRAFGASESDIFFKITLPAATPYVMAGIRLSVGLGITAMIVAEFFTAISGLGGMIVNYGAVFATSKMFVPIIIVGLMGVALTQLVQYTERRLSKWRTLERERIR